MLYRHAYPAGTGPTARVHIEDDATTHDAVRVGEKLRVQGTVSERYAKRGREYVHLGTSNCAPRPTILVADML